MSAPVLTAVTLVTALLAACGPPARGTDAMPADAATPADADAAPVPPDAGPLCTVVCSDTETCLGDRCVDACSHAADKHSYEGCEYWAVDLDNIVEFESWPQDGQCGGPFDDSALITAPLCTDGISAAGVCDPGGDCAGREITTCQQVSFCADDAQHAPFAIVVANPDDTRPVHLRLEASGAEPYETLLAAGEVRALLPQALGFPDQSVDHSGIAPLAYRLTAARPVIAYQFNPFDDVHVFSNDASLLLPRHTYGARYLAITTPSLRREPWRDDWDGTITIVAPGDGETTVTITPTADVQAGDGVPAIAAGTPTTLALRRFETLNLESSYPGDLTGTLIEADQPVGVWVGHEATNLDSTVCCADHLEDQLLPASAWGHVYALARTQPRAGMPKDALRVLAQRPGTVITISPPVAVCPVLDAGEVCEVELGEDVEISATQPILVAHFLAAAGGGGPNSGDPSLSFAVPVEQQRRSYHLLVPDTYFNNYLSIVTPIGGRVRIDGVDKSWQLTPFAGNRWAAMRIAVLGGQHRVDCPDGCAVEVYGWAEAVSYMYAAGLDVRVIVE